MIHPASDFAFVVSGGREAGPAARRAVLVWFELRSEA
jgi:hypothetical protein